MLRWLLSLFGLKIVYVWKGLEYDSRYAGIEDMLGQSVCDRRFTAPPWARAKIVRS